MDKFRMLIIVLLIGLLAGCGIPALSRNIDNHEKAGDNAKPIEPEKTAQAPEDVKAGDGSDINQPEPVETADDETELRKQKGAEYAYNKVMDSLHNGAVILLHAVSKDNSEALDRIIKGIKAEGYEIKPLDL